MDPMTMMAISGLVELGSGAYRNIKAQKGLAALEKQRLPQYMDAAAPIMENKQMYSQMAKTGMGPASLNLAKNTFAAGQNALTAAPAGGQLRTQIGRMASANAGGFANQLAGQNESIRRNAIGNVAQQNMALSDLQQRDIGVGLQRRFKAEDNYGQAIQDSRKTMLGAFEGYATASLGNQNSALDREAYGTYGNYNPNAQQYASPAGPQNFSPSEYYFPGNMNLQGAGLGMPPAYSPSAPTAPAPLPSFGRFSTPANVPFAPGKRSISGPMNKI
jgi:hypothetical protein